jgi:hypothetical protein
MLEFGHLRAKAQPAGQVELFGIARQVGMYGLVLRVERCPGFVREVAESSHLPACIRVHRGPNATAASITRPLPAETIGLFEEDGLESLTTQPARRRQSRRSCTDDRDCTHSPSARTAMPLIAGQPWLSARTD